MSRLCPDLYSQIDIDIPESDGVDEQDRARIGATLASPASRQIGCSRLARQGQTQLLAGSQVRLVVLPIGFPNMTRPSFEKTFAIARRLRRLPALNIPFPR